MNLMHAGLALQAASIGKTLADYDILKVPCRACHAQYIEKPASLCRLPDVDTEVRLIIQHRIATGTLLEECHIAPLNPEESPAETMKRLLARKRTST